jgi:hypothetical protein
VTIHIKRDTLSPGLERFDKNIVEAIHTVLDYYATTSVNEMRTGARWTDRTTNARNGLMAKTMNKTNDGGSLVLWHSVPYGIWLEVRWSGRYAIVGPVMHSVAPRIMSTLAQAIEKSSQL